MWKDGAKSERPAVMAGICRQAPGCVERFCRKNRVYMPNAELTTQEGMTETPEWNQVDSKKLERRVFKLQKRIYLASKRGDTKAVGRLQKTLLHSRSALMIAVRRVIQDNQGKKTAGVSGVKSLTPKQRLAQVSRLKLTGKSRPTRSVWIPKPGKNEKELYAHCWPTSLCKEWRKGSGNTLKPSEAEEARQKSETPSALFGTPPTSWFFTKIWI